jgi:YD repeat-containing protein
VRIVHARIGHTKELQAVFDDIGNRPIGGPATELLQGARTGLWTFKHNPGAAYLCGPRALRNVMTTLKASPKQIAVADDAQSGPHGFSLQQLADKAHFKYTLIHREPGQTIPVPSVVNWNVHHYAALTGTDEARYLLKDPTFGETAGVALSAKAIDAESSGYFLVPESVFAKGRNNGWRAVDKNSAEAKSVYGMGVASGDDAGLMMNSDKQCCGAQNSGTSDIDAPKSTPAPQAQSCPACPQGMTVASSHVAIVSLHLADTPVGYHPQIGIPNVTALFYNSREDEQPATMSFSNVSPKWNFSWQTYVRDNPGGGGSQGPVIRNSSGGGGFSYYSYSSTTGQFAVESPDSSQTFRTPAVGNPATAYTHQLPDGSKEVFNLSNGSTAYPRLMFLTSVVDPKGNATTINYDATFRVTSVVDAMGRSTTFTYGLTSHPLLVTQITDPFSRTTQLTYDTSLRLATITDPVGITSTFTYSTTETTFVKQLVTPYGTSTFSDTINPNDPSEDNTRSLTITDPLGYTDYLYFYQNGACTITPCTTRPCQPA